ncbi:hypothetical protein TMEN_552 [Trichophyton mentagrophytes]|nr:hypothetical protein TMEN_552 [Trichophyton mentagrophytes]
MAECGDSLNVGHGHLFPEFHFDRPTTDPRAYQVINPLPLQGKISKYLAPKPIIIILYKYRNELLAIEEHNHQQRQQEARGAGQELGQLREPGALDPPEEGGRTHAQDQDEQGQVREHGRQQPRWIMWGVFRRDGAKLNSGIGSFKDLRAEDQRFFRVVALGVVTLVPL